VRREPIASLIFQPVVLILLTISFLVSAGNYGFLFWFPTVLDSLRQYSRSPLSDLQIGVLNGLPYVTAATAMVLISKHSDRTQERLWHVGIPLACAGILLLLSVFVGERSPNMAFVLLCLATTGSFGMMGPFWSIPTEWLPPAAAGAAIGLIQLSNLGGALGPLLAGLVERQTGSFKDAFGLMALGWCAAGALCLLLQRRAVRPHLGWVR
jgi:predicted MFS family arabinose efflux permease